MMRNRVGLLATALIITWGMYGGTALAMETEDCLDCHGDLSIVEQGQKGRLFIDAATYQRTAHADEGCLACHESVGDGHPKDGVRPSRASCGDCHDDVEEEIAASAHADNAACTDCHNPHQVKGIVAATGAEMNRTCAACHATHEMVETHGKWLLQTELHLAALPCVTCHTSSESYVITFYIERLGGRKGSPGEPPTLARPEELRMHTRGKDLTLLMDKDADGLISVQELSAFNRGAQRMGLGLWGMMTPESASHSYTTLDNRWDCTFCHASGPGAAQTSYVAFPTLDGALVRVPVERGAIVETVYGSIDFYMIGATRNDTLSAVGLAIVAGGLLVPLIHGTARLLTRKNRKEG